MGNNKANTFRQAFITGALTFFIAIAVSAFSQLFLERVQSLLLSFILLVIIILTGIIFDIIGIAAAVASEAPFHAKAAKKVRGAVQALNLLRNADRVSSFCNDIVGDIAGTASGALGAAIVFQIVTNKPTLNEAVFSIAMTALVAAATVGGKSAGKKMAITQSEEIIFRVAQVLAWFEEITGFVSSPKQKSIKRR